MPLLFEKFPTIFNSTIFTWANFIWAYEVFWSRALSVEAPWISQNNNQYLQSKHILSKNNEEEEMEEMETFSENNRRIAALVPVIDLLNHSPTSKVTFFTGNF
jgi:hypothetical protein